MICDRRQLLPFAVALALALGGPGCADFGRGDDPPAVADAGGDGDGASTPLAFGADVHPLLLDRCGQCHRAGAPRAFFLTTDPDADYDGVVALVNPSDPDASLLLRKAAGFEGHSAGRIIAPASEAYATVRRWIAEGAPL